jgi:hypothetical protein
LANRPFEKDGRPEFAVIPYAEYERFLELIEDEADARALAEFHTTRKAMKTSGTRGGGTFASLHRGMS